MLIMLAKANEFHKRLCDVWGESSESFASSGWLWNLSEPQHKATYIQGEICQQKTSSWSIHHRFPIFRKDGIYTLDQIFTATKQACNLKTLATHFDRFADGRKTQKQRVTNNAWSNASVTINLPLLMIGNAKNPRCFKNIHCDYHVCSICKSAKCFDECTLVCQLFYHNFSNLFKTSRRRWESIALIRGRIH